MLLLPVKQLLWAWNNALPPDILIRSIEEVSDSFHPQRNVEQKTYYYHFFEQRPLPFIGRYGFFCGKFRCREVALLGCKFLWALMTFAHSAQGTRQRAP